MKTGLDKIDIDSIDWDAEIKKPKKEYPKPIIWKEEDIKDNFGYRLYEGDRILRVKEPRYSDPRVFVEGTIKMIDLTKEYPLGVLSDGKDKIGWVSLDRVLSSKAIRAKI